MSIISDCEKMFADMFGAKYCIMMNSGTATLHAAIEAIGGKNMAVVSPALTVFMDTAATLHANCYPVYVDVDPGNWLIDPKELNKYLLGTRAILAVGLYGLEVPKEIINIGKENDIPVIEDNAQAFNMSFSGDIASYSFESSKHISCGEGGCVITNNEDYAQFMREFGNHGYAFNTAEGGRTKLTSDELSNPNFKRHSSIGYNYRMPEPCAYELYGKLPKLPELVNMRIHGAEIYIDNLPDVDWIKLQAVTGKHSYWTLPLFIDQDWISTQEFIAKFYEFGGDVVRACWSVPYQEPAFINTGYEFNKCPTAELLQKSIIQFKTNYLLESEFINQAKILNKTIRHFA